jgi:hypothetical protein
MRCGFKHCRQPPAQPAQLIRLLTRLGDAVPHCIRSLQCWTVTILADCLSYVGSMLATLLPSSPAGCLSWPRPSSQGKQQQEGQLAWGSRARRIRQAQLCRVTLSGKEPPATRCAAGMLCAVHVATRGCPVQGSQRWCTIRVHANVTVSKVRTTQCNASMHQNRCMCESVWPTVLVVKLQLSADMQQRGRTEQYMPLFSGTHKRGMAGQACPLGQPLHGVSMGKQAPASVTAAVATLDTV